MTEHRLVPVDEFGAAVARRLLTHRRAALVDPDALRAPIARPHPGLLVVAGSARRTELTAINDLAAAEDVPWLPVVLRQTRIDIGPVIGPGSEACYRCMQARVRQHDPHRRTTEEVDASATRRTAFLPAHVRQAAGIATRLTAARPRTPHRAPVLSFGLHGAAPVTAHPVMGVHGCPGCGLRPSAAPEQWRNP